MKTRGVHSDQLAAAIQATEHALNMIALRTPPAKGREPRTKRRGALRGMHGTTQHKKIAERSPRLRTSATRPRQRHAN